MSVLEILLLLAVAVLGSVAWKRSRELRDAIAHQADLAQTLTTQRTQHEAAAQEQARRTAALFDRMVEGVIVVDAAGRIRLANRAASELFGFAPPAADQTVLEATRRHEVAALITRLEHEPEVLNHELRIDAAAAPCFLQINAVALRSAGGDRDGAILVFHDLTRLRQLESVRQDFVANVSHELRTPLSLIKSATETLLDGGKDDPAVNARFLEIIVRHASRLALLIDDLLLLARLDSGRIELHVQPVPLHAAAQEALDDAMVPAEARAITLENHVPAGLVAQADPARLHQVLANLIDNAVKYGRNDGHVVLTGRALDPTEVELSVRDDGPGIAPEAMARIFERFYRADKARAREQGGTGLGLAIVKHVVQAHGGDVRVESTLGVSTEFFITLPTPKG